jgi:hypothetical protein
MLLLKTEDMETLIQKAVLVLSWHGAERAEDIKLHLSKDVSRIPYDFNLKKNR